MSHGIGSGDDTTTPTATNTTAVMEKKTRACKRKGCSDADTTNTSTATEAKKRACKRKDCGDADTTNTSTGTETKKRACRRTDCGDTDATSTSTATETKKRAYRRKECVGTNTPTLTEKKKIAYESKGCGDTDMTSTSTATEAKKRACRRKDCAGTDTPTLMEKKKTANKRKDCGDTGTVMEIKTKRACRRKDCGDTNTPTVIEKKKRVYRRRDSGDSANTSMATEANKQASKRKDCGDTNTSPLTEKKKKRAYRRKDCIIGTSTPALMEKKKSAYRRKKCLPHDLVLPHDLIVEEILTRLPVPSLLKSVRVSKLWYHSIHNDHKRLTHSHFLQSQKRPQVIFSLLNVRSGFQPNTDDTSYACHFFKFTTGTCSYDHVLRFDEFRNALTQPHMWELVGYCNGLPCMAEVGHYSTRYMISDPNRDDFLCIFYPATVGICTPYAHIICHGFGFDPSANEYKLASIFRTAENELNFLVFTLGTKSWRNVTAVTTPMSAHGGRPIIKLRAPTGSDKSAIFCATSSSRSSGCLVWKIIATLGGAGTNHIQHDVNNEMEMLLSFNLHDEKFQIIQLPAKSTTDEQKKNSLVDYPHLLEFMGSPCIVRTEKISGNGSDYPHRWCDDHQGSTNCCCCCKVHLYVLKGEVEQAWVKEESFDVCVNSSPRFLRELGTLASDPCCFCLSSTTTPPTRIFSFSDQMLLYWFNGEHLHVYNLRSEKLELVLPSYTNESAIFRAKRKEPRHIYNSSGDDDIYFSNMDYQLHCHEENFLSLETFIPEGVQGVDADDFSKLDLEREDRPCSAVVYINRGSKVFYPCFN